MCYAWAFVLLPIFLIVLVDVLGLTIVIPLLGIYAMVFVTGCFVFSSQVLVYAFVSASEPDMGGAFFCVNVACLDDVTPDELAGITGIGEKKREAYGAAVLEVIAESAS